MYKLGAVGLGHWFERLYEGMKKGNRIKVVKAVGTSEVERKIELLNVFGIEKNNYYKINPDGSIPDEFFSDLDIVHISDPNKFHSEQAIQSLEKGKYVIVEKTIGVTKDEFDRTIKYVEENGYRDRMYLHLHYTHKLLTLELPSILFRFTKDYGRIKKIGSAFFEEENDSDMKRSRWLFNDENGGLFMDWIHPYEIVILGALAEKITIRGLKQYAVNQKYSNDFPTGVETFMEVNGEYFSDDAAWISRISKGVPKGKGIKKVWFIFENGFRLDLHYISSELEFNSDKRGEWKLFDDKNRLLKHESPKGKTSSEILVEDIVEMCIGNAKVLTIDKIKKLFEPQWKYQELSKNSALITDNGEVDKFINSGMGE